MTHQKLIAAPKLTKAQLDWLRFIGLGKLDVATFAGSQGRCLERMKISGLLRVENDMRDLTHVYRITDKGLAALRARSKTEGE